MIDLVQSFREGGAAMYAILLLNACGGLLGPVALLVAGVARFTNKGRTAALVLGILALMAAILPMCAGAGGYYLGMSRVEHAVLLTAPAYKEILLETGRSEASNNLTFGFSSGCCLLLPALLALLLVPPKQIVYDDVV